MTKKQPEETKLLMLSSDLVDRLRETSVKKETSLSGYAMNVLEEGLRAEKLGASPKDVVDAYFMSEIHKGAGVLIMPKSSLGQIIEKLGQDQLEGLEKLWDEAGRWYGKYLLSKINSNEVLHFVRQDLLNSWNLDEVEIKIEDNVSLRFIGFMMSEELTHLLLSYMHGLMESLGYKEIERDSLRGMATIKYMQL